MKKLILFIIVAFSLIFISSQFSAIENNDILVEGQPDGNFNNFELENTLVASPPINSSPYLGDNQNNVVLNSNFCNWNIPVIMTKSFPSIKKGARSNRCKNMKIDESAMCNNLRSRVEILETVTSFQRRKIFDLQRQVNNLQARINELSSKKINLDFVNYEQNLKIDNNSTNENVCACSSNSPVTNFWGINSDDSIISKITKNDNDKSFIY